VVSEILAKKMKPLSDSEVKKKRRYEAAADAAFPCTAIISKISV
jgi:hypothetical protein